MPQPTTERDLAKHVEQVNIFYAQLQPVLLAFKQKHPELVHSTMDMSKADGLSRILDLVPNVQQYVMAALDMPGMEPLKPMADYASRTSEIFAQSRALLEQHHHDSLVTDTGAIGLNDLLEAYLLETYNSFDALHPPKGAGVSTVTNEGAVASGHIVGKGRHE